MSPQTVLNHVRLISVAWNWSHDVTKIKRSSGKFETEVRYSLYCSMHVESSVICTARCKPVQYP